VTAGVMIREGLSAGSTNANGGLDPRPILASSSRRSPLTNHHPGGHIPRSTCRLTSRAMIVPSPDKG